MYRKIEGARIDKPLILVQSTKTDENKNIFNLLAATRTVDSCHRFQNGNTYRIYEQPRDIPDELKSKKLPKALDEAREYDW